MRKNSPRKWLHAVLDLLPVILIPVFMIYSHRHDLSTDIQVEEPVVKDFVQFVVNGEPTGYDNFSYNGSISYFDGFLCNTLDDDFLLLEFDIDFTYSSSDIAYISFDYYTDGSYKDNVVSVYDENYVFNENISLENSSYHFSTLVDISSSGSTSLLSFDNQQVIGSFYIKDVQIFNLTTIFGSGNEPSKDVFESYLQQSYYSYGSNDVVVGYQLVNAKNNDIMSVFIDAFNNSINKYFNMGNVFNLTGVYQWFNVHIFNGNAPQVIYSVWNIALYELVMDLLFLLYGLFMWFIDMVQHLMDKPFKSIK